MPPVYGRQIITHLDACRVALSADGTLPDWIQLIPSGAVVKTCDGREFRNPNPQAIIEQFAQHGLDLPVDYEHASELKAKTGEESPAAGWISQLEVRAGAIWGKVDWTERGAKSLTSKEYRYFSPAFVRSKDGAITALASGALTNQPAFNQLPALAHEELESELELAAQWDTSFINDLPDSAFLFVEGGGTKDADGRTVPRSLRHFPYRGPDGGIDLPHLRNAIARIPQSTVAGVDKQKLQEKAQRLLAEHNQAATASQENDMDKELLAALGLGEKATADEAKAAIAVLKQASAELASAKTELARAQTPDLGKFVPRADYDVQLARAEVAEKAIASEKAAALKKEIDAEIDAAVKAGKVTPATKSFYVETCSTAEGLVKFREFVKAAPVIAPDNASPEGRPAVETASQVTADQREIIEKCGLTIEQFQKGKE